jgi:pseudaminic acid biosynthesis-associated methylase
MNTHMTEEEQFWKGEFGTEYIDRNKGKNLLASNLNLFSKALNQVGVINNCVEFGANVGMNLRALQLLYPKIKVKGIEINECAANELKSSIGEANVFLGSILDWNPDEFFDLVLVKGVLIHINPEKLNLVYQKLYESSNRYILICEYYNRTPITIPYRGYNNRLYKRDFSGEMLDLFTDLTLVNYGFSYHRDQGFPQDDLCWFLLTKI